MKKKKLTRNFRVHYQINGINYHSDFSIRGAITQETISISARHRIKEVHPDIMYNEVTDIDIEELSVW